MLLKQYNYLLPEACPVCGHKPLMNQIGKCKICPDKKANPDVSAPDIKKDLMGADTKTIFSLVMI
jgi:hypothetical protein